MLASLTLFVRADATHHALPRFQLNDGISRNDSISPLTKTTTIPPLVSIVWHEQQLAAGAFLD